MPEHHDRPLFALGLMAYAAFYLTIVLAIPPGIKLYFLLERVW